MGQYFLWKKLTSCTCKLEERSNREHSGGRRHAPLHGLQAAQSDHGPKTRIQLLQNHPHRTLRVLLCRMSFLRAQGKERTVICWYLIEVHLLTMILDMKLILCVLTVRSGDGRADRAGCSCDHERDKREKHLCKLDLLKRASGPRSDILRLGGRERRMRA